VKKKYLIPKIFVFIGDSHVVSLTDSRYERIIGARFSRIKGRNHLFISLWFRDTLAFQVSKGESPKAAERLARVFGSLKNIGAKFVFCFGEIDVRCHLADPEKNTNFLNLYVLNCIKLVNAKPKDMIFLTPTPPSDFYMNHPSFPRLGSLIDRVRAHNNYCAELEKYTKLNFSHFINSHSVLVNGQGGLRRELTEDGCHLNSEGAAIVRGIVSKSLS
jgi:lysophospholipase L1-like esterase